MKYFIMVLSIVAMSASAQEMQCVEVPKGHKVVFIPTLIPTDELIWKWSHAKDTKKDDKCGELTVSPGTCPK